MNFNQNEEQQLLVESLRRYLGKDYAFEARRDIICSPEGTSAAAWHTFADMGLLALALPAEHEGFGQGAAELMPVMEAFGDALVVEPFAATVAAARLIERASSDAQRSALLPGVAAGTTKLAFAQEAAISRQGAAGVSLRARRADGGGGGWVLDGTQRLVLHAPAADRIIVPARTSGADTDEAGVSLFMLDGLATQAAGLSASTYRTFDNQVAADLHFAGMQLPADALLGSDGAAFAAIDEAVDFATALMCAEAVGAMHYANQATLEYIKTRKQFGVPIGSFQALQHRMVDMVIEWELARSMALLACTKVDQTRAATDAAADAVRERRRVVSAAKIRVSEAARKVAQESVQLHGGMGLTEELKISHTFRRLTTITLSLGDVDHHLARFTGHR